MDFQKLVDVYEQLESTASGNEIREILAQFFKTVDKEDISKIAYLTLGTISSEYQSIVLGLADKSVLKAIASAGGAEASKIKKLMQELGDPGLVAEKVLQKKPQTLIPVGKLTFHELFDQLHKIATTSGVGSQDKKTNLLVALLQKSSATGAKYVCRIALGTLRMGVAAMTILDALAIAFTGEKKNKEFLEKAYNICPDVGLIAEVIANKGLKGLDKITVNVGRPIKMMLCQRVESLDEVPNKIEGEFTVEAKYDGERIQAHKAKLPNASKATSNSKGTITLFSRKLENITNQFPDLVQYLEKVKAEEFILEGEVLAINEKGEHLPFQTLMQRRRKHDVEEYIKKIPVRLKCFDLLYLDAETLLNKSYLERQKKLSQIIPKGKHLTLTETIVTSNPADADKFFREMLDEGFEGIIIKSHSGEYQAGTRGWNWIKWKKDYAQEMLDTLDVVIVGAFHGKGRRSGGYGALLCAIYDPERDEFLTICKLGSGLTDAMITDLPAKLEKYKTNKKPARLNLNKEMTPDVWFNPEIVVEVLGAELTKSTIHTAGLAVRFPRFIRFREKKAEQATSLEEVKEMA